MSRTGGNKSVTYPLVMVLAVVLILTVYYFVINKETPEQEQVVSTYVQEVLLRDLADNYPPTPKEVVKYFSEITECFYNETYTEDELVQLSEKIKLLYDDELLQSIDQNTYLDDLKADIADLKDKQITMYNFTVSASTDVVYFSENDQSWAGLYCFYDYRSGTSFTRTKQVFILRKDSAGHWKIYGWQIAAPEEETGE